MINVPKGQRKIFMHLVTCISSGVIAYGYMLLSSEVDSVVIIMALTAIGGHGMVNSHANGKEHQGEPRSWVDGA